MSIPNLTPHTRQTNHSLFHEDDWHALPSGIAAPSSYLPQKRMNAIDLFAGAGGFSLGLKQAGINVVAALEWDESAALTYMHNLCAYPLNIHFITEADADRMNDFMLKHVVKTTKEGLEYLSSRSGDNWPAIAANCPPGVRPTEHYFFGDVRKITGQEMLDKMGMKREEIDMIVGGPPCQGFSHAGKRHVMDPRNSLVFDFVRIVLDIRPNYMVMENVPGMIGMVTPEGVPVVDAICRMLEAGNYGDYEALKKSLTYGIDSRAAVRGSKSRKSYKGVDDEEDVELEPTEFQMSLFR